MPQLTFFYDVVCPYAFLGSTQVEKLASLAGIDVEWRPVLLGGIYRSIEAPQEPGRHMPPEKARLNALDLMRQGDLLGQPVQWHPQHPIRSVNAMRLLVGCADAVRPRLTHALYRTYWLEHGDISDRATLDRVAQECGADSAVIDDPAVKQGLFSNTAEAVALGGFGVPIWKVTFDDGRSRFWWGTDRIGLVAKALGVDWPAPGRHPRSEAPEPIRFFHDVASPYSYLASTQIERVAEEEGAELEWVPILLGGLFREIGTPNFPMAASSPPKQRYYAQDMVDWGAHWDVPFRMPDAFPMRTVLPQRVLLVEPTATRSLYDAAWRYNLNIGDPDVLLRVLNDAGFDGANLIERTQDPAIKAQLIANTKEARALGACGVPTFHVNGHTFWGQDRLDHVRQAVRGWQPPEG